MLGREAPEVYIQHLLSGPGTGCGEDGERQISITLRLAAGTWICPGQCSLELWGRKLGWHASSAHASLRASRMLSAQA